VTGQPAIASRPTCKGGIGWGDPCSSSVQAGRHATSRTPVPPYQPSRAITIRYRAAGFVLTWKVTESPGRTLACEV
jgi:hypothetical protein